MSLINDLGFDAIDAGARDESWRQQPGTPVYTADRNAEDLRRGLNEASRQRKPEFAAKPGTQRVA